MPQATCVFLMSTKHMPVFCKVFQSPPGGSPGLPDSCLLFYHTVACFLQGLPHSRLLVSQVYQATPGWIPQVYHTVACFLIGLQHSSLLFCQVYHTVACAFARFTNHHLVIAPGLPHSCLLFHKFTKGRLVILSVLPSFFLCSTSGKIYSKLD